MYLIGHTNPTLIMRVYQQVMDVGTLAARRSRRRSGARSVRPSHCFLAEELWQPIGQPAERNASEPRRVERAGRRRNRLVTGTSRKRLMGLEPTTFCMASRAPAWQRRGSALQMAVSAPSPAPPMRVVSSASAGVRTLIGHSRATRVGSPKGASASLLLRRPVCRQGSFRSARAVAGATDVAQAS
jgi:hypothetical protein